MAQLTYTCLPSPVGLIGMAATEGGICRLDLNVVPVQFSKKLEKLYRCLPVEDETRFADIKHALDGYFSGTVTKFDIDIEWKEGTEFQRRVWQTLLMIPYGRVESYAWVAKQVGRPKAVRAVGQANGRNPVAIIVPCHRVVRADGTIGGFGSGIEIKKELLRREGLPLNTWENHRVTV